MIKYLFIFILSTCSAFAFNFNVSSSNIANGKTALIEFDKNTKYEKMIIGKKTYKIFTNPIEKSKSYVLLPISYYEKPNNKKIELVYKENNKEKIKVSSKKHREANKESIRKWQKEYRKENQAKIKKAKAKYYADNRDVINSVSEKSYINKKFIVPLDTKITSSFGKAEFIMIL